jgi:hypothetical protein
MSTDNKRDTRRKLFISYSDSDEDYLNHFEDSFGHLFAIKSVKQEDIGTDVSTEYIERLIRADYISVVSVVIVLVGNDTWSRKHVDWEIAAALTRKVDGYSGLLGLCLPTHPDYRKNQYKKDIVPLRLVDNIKTEYAKLYDWTESESDIKAWVEDAFQARVSRTDKIDNSRPHFTDNWLSYAGRSLSFVDNLLGEDESSGETADYTDETADSTED